MTCGCYIQDDSWQPRNPSTIVYCTIHEAAIDMHAALLALLNCPEPPGCDDCRARARRAYVLGIGSVNETP